MYSQRVANSRFSRNVVVVVDDDDDGVVKQVRLVQTVRKDVPGEHTNGGYLKLKSQAQTVPKILKYCITSLPMR